MLLTTVLGAIFSGLYLATGSLLLPILFHVAVDVRGLLLPLHTDPTTKEPPGR
ncbi:MAG: CPBP family intramembrane metalloprotease [Actinomycetota bacterium]|nr:CPBP family intramembrane metalloprotease [Actinomycetota bacterium]